jgi:hypothetical protein
MRRNGAARRSRGWPVLLLVLLQVRLARHRPSHRVIGEHERHGGNVLRPRADTGNGARPSETKCDPRNERERDS